jgi:hypothetical protein
VVRVVISPLLATEARSKPGERNRYTGYHRGNRFAGYGARYRAHYSYIEDKNR